MLGVYSWGPDWIIAEDPSDALIVVKEHAGYDEEELSEYIENEGLPCLLEMEESLRINFSEKEDIPEKVEKNKIIENGSAFYVKEKMSFWISIYGRSFLCSTEY